MRTFSGRPLPPPPPGRGGGGADARDPPRRAGRAEDDFAVLVALGGAELGLGGGAVGEDVEDENAVEAARLGPLIGGFSDAEAGLGFLGAADEVGHDAVDRVGWE